MKYWALFILLFVTSLSFGQSRYYRVEAMGGASVASMPDSVLFDRANYFHFGINNYFEIGKKLNLNASILFSRKGTKKVNPTFLYQYNNLELDLFHKLRLADDLHLKLGFGSSYLLNAQRVVLDGGQSSGTQRLNIANAETINMYYEIGVITKLQDKLGAYVSWQRNIEFTHESVLLQEFRFGLTYQITDVRWLKESEQ